MTRRTVLDVQQDSYETMAAQAAAAGDRMTEAICWRAADGVVDIRLWNLLTDAERAAVSTMTQNAARRHLRNGTRPDTVSFSKRPTPARPPSRSVLARVVVFALVSVLIVLGIFVALAHYGLIDQL